MAFIVVHNKTGHYLSRKGIKNSLYRVTADIGASQLFNTKQAASGTIKIVEDNFKLYRKWENGAFASKILPVPADGFTIHEANLTVGDAV